MLSESKPKRRIKVGVEIVMALPPDDRSQKQRQGVEETGGTDCLLVWFRFVSCGRVPKSGGDGRCGF